MKKRLAVGASLVVLAQNAAGLWNCTALPYPYHAAP